MRYLILLILMIGTAHAKTEAWTDVVETLSPATIEISENGKTKKHIALLFVRGGDEPDEIDNSSVQAAARWLQNYWRYFTGHEWDVEVRGYTIYMECSPLAPNYCEEDVYEWVATHDLKGFEPNYFHLNGGWRPGYCGQAGLHSVFGVTYGSIWSTCGVKTMAHELGHQLGGWHHAGTLDVLTGSVTEYMDGSAIMGNNATVQGLISNNFIQEGLTRSFNLIESSQQIILAPIGISTLGLREGEIQHHMIDVGEYPYTLSLRKTAGARFAPRTNGQGIYIHQVRPNGKTKRIEVLYPDEAAYVLPNGVTIEYLDYSKERALVEVKMYDGDIIPQTKTLDNSWILPEGAYISKAHDGAWYDPKFDGQGFVFFIKGDTAGVYWFTYNQDTDERRWYYGVCQIDECMSGFDLRTTEYGTFSDPTKRADRVIGKAQFYFTDTNAGVFSYRTDEHGRGRIPLTALAFSADSDLNGVWYTPSMNGSGMTVQKIGDMLGVYWFTYGPRDPFDFSGKANVTQRWYMALGYEKSGSYEMTIYEAQGGQWLWLSEVDLIPVGTATITPQGDKLKFTYGINAEGVKGSGVWDMKRIF